MLFSVNTVFDTETGAIGAPYYYPNDQIKARPQPTSRGEVHLKTPVTLPFYLNFV